MSNTSEKAQNALAVKIDEQLKELVAETVAYEGAKSGKETIHNLATKMKAYFDKAGDGTQSLDTLFTLYDGHCQINGLGKRNKQRCAGMMALTDPNIGAEKFPILREYGERNLIKTYFRWIDASRLWKGGGIHVREKDAKGNYPEYFASAENLALAIKTTLATRGRNAGKKGGARVAETIVKKKTAEDRKEFWRNIFDNVPAEQFTEIRSALNAAAKDHKADENGQPPAPEKVKAVENLEPLKKVTV